MKDLEFVDTIKYEKTTSDFIIKDKYYVKKETNLNLKQQPVSPQI